MNKQEKLRQVYTECLLQENEREEGKPIVRYCKGIGISETVEFNVTRINEHKSKILELINDTYEIEKAPHFSNLVYDKKGNQWTTDNDDIDKLLMLGLASEILEIPFDLPREEWENSFPNGQPFVIENIEKAEMPVQGIDPKRSAKVIKKGQKSNNRS